MAGMAMDLNEEQLKEIFRRMNCHKFKHSYGNFVSQCPFASISHQNGVDKHPSFGIQAQHPHSWNCFTCGSKGKTIKSLLRKYEEHFGHNPAPELFETKVIGEYDLRKSSSRFKKEDFKFDISDYEHILENVPQYILDRGVTLEQCDKWLIGYDKRDVRVFFTILDRYGDMVGFSKRAIQPLAQPKYLHALNFHRNKYLYGMQFKEGTDFAFVAEGFMDVLNLDKCGYQNVYALMGTASSIEQINFLSAFKHVFIFPDNDKKDANGISPGLRAAAELKNKLSDIRVKAYIVPTLEHRKDVGEYNSDEIDYVLSKAGNEFADSEI